MLAVDQLTISAGQVTISDDQVIISDVIYQMLAAGHVTTESPEEILVVLAPYRWSSACKLGKHICGSEVLLQFLLTISVNAVFIQT